MKKDADITDYSKVENTAIQYCEKNRPTIIINCAALTNVDYCETHYDEAYKVNTIGPRYLAILAKKYNALLIHVSTDYVYDSSSVHHIKIENPLNVYGKTKLAGEKVIAKEYEDASHKNYMIFRTSGLYSKYSLNNFLLKLEKMLESGKSVELIADQEYCPTYAENLAKQILTFTSLVDYDIEYIYKNEGHIVDAVDYEYTTPYRFLIDYLIARKKYKLVELVKPITFDEYFAKNPERAKRPQYAILKNQLAKYGKEVFRMQSIQESIKNFVDELENYER